MPSCFGVNIFYNLIFVIFAQRNSRYDGQLAVFGEEFQKRLESLKYFLVSDFKLIQENVAIIKLLQELLIQDVNCLMKSPSYYKVEHS